MEKSKKRKIIPAVLLLVVAGGFCFWYWHRAGGLVLEGEVEGTSYSQITEVPGKIVEMNIELGGQVKSGGLIARLDNMDQKYALEQMQIALEKRKLTLKSLLKGAKQEELDKASNDVSIAEANYRSAAATYNRAKENADRLARLLDTGGIAQSDLDNARLQETVSSEALEAAKNQAGKAGEQLSLLRKGADEETVALAQEDILDAESRIRQMQETLNKYEIYSNCDGTVISKNYNLGSMVNPGYNLADISADNEKYVVCYVPKDDSIRITYGQPLVIRSGKKEYEGQVRFIDVKSQYTPKDMQTSTLRNKVSVKVKLLLPPDAALKSGDRVEVVLPGHDVE